MMNQQDLEQGIDVSLTYPGLTDIVAHVQLNNSYLQFKDADSLINHYQLIGFPTMLPTGIEVSFNHRIERPSNQEVLQKSEFPYQESNIWPFALASGLPIGILEFGYKQALNGLLRRLADFGGSLQQSGPSAFLADGSATELIHFDTTVTPETVNVTLDDDGNEKSTTTQQDGKIEINVTQGRGTLEYSLDNQNYQSEAVFDQLHANTYQVYVRSQQDMAAGGLPRYQVVTVGQNRVENGG